MPFAGEQDGHASKASRDISPSGCVQFSMLEGGMGGGYGGKEILVRNLLVFQKNGGNASKTHGIPCLKHIRMLQANLVFFVPT